MQGFCSLHDRHKNLLKKYGELKDHFHDRDRDVRSLKTALENSKVILVETQAYFKEKEEDFNEVMAEAEALKAQLAKAEKSTSKAKAGLGKATTDLEKLKVESQSQYTKGYEDARDYYEGQVK